MGMKMGLHGDSRKTYTLHTIVQLYTKNTQTTKENIPRNLQNNSPDGAAAPDLHGERPRLQPIVDMRQERPSRSTRRDQAQIWRAHAHAQRRLLAVAPGPAAAAFGGPRVRQGGVIAARPPRPAAQLMPREQRRRRHLPACPAKPGIQVGEGCERGLFDRPPPETHEPMLPTPQHDAIRISTGAVGSVPRAKHSPPRLLCRPGLSPMHLPPPLCRNLPPAEPGARRRRHDRPHIRGDWGHSV